jgi:Protein of unknown function (DUF664)
VRRYKRDDDPDADFTDATADPAVVEEAFSTWRTEIAESDAWLDGISDEDLATMITVDLQPVGVRDILVHLIEEYARHAGHADLLRECIDGRTGQ